MFLQLFAIFTPKKRCAWRAYNPNKLLRRIITGFANRVVTAHHKNGNESESPASRQSALRAK